MTYSIFQLPQEHDNVFMNYGYAQNHGGVKFSEYNTVYTGEIAGNDPHEILENLFYIFNCKHPDDYAGRSLSVSDLVALEATGTYFCDSYGWQKIN